LAEVRVIAEPRAAALLASELSSVESSVWSVPLRVGRGGHGVPLGWEGRRDVLEAAGGRDMTWGEFKAAVEAQGVKDDDELSWIDVSSFHCAPEVSRKGA
jgi:hypothetical protein